jgi:ADP-heptose:LPS heptosyltransferase
LSLKNYIKASFLKFFTNKISKKFDIKDVKKVLFLRYDRIGDMIITTPVFRELKLFSPEMKISVIASETNQTVLLNNPYIDDIYINHKNNLFKDFLILLYLRKQKFDACVEFDHSVIPHAILRLLIIKPKIIISVFKEGRYGVKGEDLNLYDYFTKKNKKSHCRDIWLETLSPFGLEPQSNSYDLFCTEAQKKEARKFIKNFPEKFLIGINLEGAVEGKKIHYEDLENFCKSIFSFHNDIKIIILTAPNKFKSVNEKIIKMGLDYVIMSYRTDSILDVSALIEKLDLIVTPDTSIVHIASAFDKPIVSIHENNQDSYHFFAPTSKLNRTVFSESKNSLKNYPMHELIGYCSELINLKKKKL